MVAKGGLLEGKRGLIIGVANKRSIAWGIAQRATEAGAQHNSHLGPKSWRTPCDHLAHDLPK